MFYSVLGEVDYAVIFVNQLNAGKDRVDDSRVVREPHDEDGEGERLFGSARH